MYRQLERIRRYENAHLVPQSPLIHISVMTHMVPYVSELVSSMGLTDRVYIQPYTPYFAATEGEGEGEGEGPTILVNVNNLAILFGDHVGPDFDAVVSALGENTLYVNTGQRPPLQPIRNTIFSSASTAEIVNWIVSLMSLDAIKALDLTDFDVSPLLTNTFDQICVVSVSAEDELVAPLRSVVPSVIHLVVNRDDQQLRTLLLQNPAYDANDQVSPMFDTQTKTLFVLSYSTPQEYYELVSQLGSDPRYGQNYMVLIGTGACTYRRNEDPQLPPSAHTWSHSLLYFPNMSVLGHKVFNRMDNSVPLSSSAWALGDLLQDLAPLFHIAKGSAIALQDRGYADEQGIYFRKNRHVFGHLLTHTGRGGSAQSYLQYTFSASYNPFAAGTVVNTATATMNSGAIDIATGLSVGYWCIPLNENRWLKVVFTGCTLTLNPGLDPPINIVMAMLLALNLCPFIQPPVYWYPGEPDTFSPFNPPTFVYIPDGAATITLSISGLLCVSHGFFGGISFSGTPTISVSTNLAITTYFPKLGKWLNNYYSLRIPLFTYDQRTFLFSNRQIGDAHGSQVYGACDMVISNTATIRLLLVGVIRVPNSSSVRTAITAMANWIMRYVPIYGNSGTEFVLDTDRPYSVVYPVASSSFSPNVSTIILGNLTMDEMEDYNSYRFLTPTIPPSVNTGYMTFWTAGTFSWLIDAITARLNSSVPSMNTYA